MIEMPLGAVRDNFGILRKTKGKRVQTRKLGSWLG